MKPGTVMGDDLIGGQQWKQMMLSGEQALGEKRQEVNALNVFPVPDGDTGTNMHLTIQSAAKEATRVPGNSLSEVAAAVATGSLMGARGNSGVILSQLMRGMAKGLEGNASANALQVAQALQTGVDTAYKAVMKPVEGTILTVSRETARGALSKAKEGGTVLEVLREGYRKGLIALAKTPEQLPVLKQAGVVDAGGQGFLAILSGWISALEAPVKDEHKIAAQALPAPQAVPLRAADNPQPFSHSLTVSASTTVSTEDYRGQRASVVLLEDLEYPYCTEFLLKGQNISVEKIRSDLMSAGDCLLVVGTPEVVKIHVHTKNPGKVLDYALRWGTLNEVAIHNMLAQNEAMAHASKESQTDNNTDADDNRDADNSIDADNNTGADNSTDDQFNRPEEEPGEPSGESRLRENGIVAVAMGEGIARVFMSLGADQVVSGGQTMNPSTEDLVEAVRRVPARNVYILPNNGNIILAARQVCEVLKDKEVHVIASKTIPQGISALLNYSAEGNAGQNLKAMESALNRVGSGEVTYAVRDSEFGELKISSGDRIGLVEDKLVAAGKSLLEVARQTLEKMRWREYDLVTIFFGRDAKPEEAGQLQAWLQQENPNVEVEVYPGGQPLYYYIFGVE